MHAVRSLAISISLACGGVAFCQDYDSELSFVDLRLQGGLRASDGSTAAITLMCGDIGDKEKHVVDPNSDLGIVIGVRGSSSRIRTDIQNFNKQDLYLLGGAALIGIGYYVNPTDHMELVLGYERGYTSLTGDHHRIVQNGRYTAWLGELGYYRTLKKHWQIGAVVGATFFKAKLNDPSGEIAAKVTGADAALEIGYRF